MPPKKRALISVSDKRYITNLARDLIKYGYELVASGGTYRKLKESGIPARELARVIHAPEMLGGRVKTLHTAVAAGILADRSNTLHLKDLDKHGIVPFDLVVVNFYAFSEKVQAGKTLAANSVEHIDIGGPTMVRAAAKNYQSVAVLTNVEQYRDFLRELKAGDGTIPLEYRLRLAAEAFACTAAYEASLASYFAYVAPKAAEETAQDTAAAATGAAPTSSSKPLDVLPEKVNLQLKREETLRYGENPHQKAARYSTSGMATLNYKIVQGDELSYNNYHDASAAIAAVSASYGKPLAACVVKHQNPCGISIGTDPLKTFIEAREADAESAFGGIVGLNYPVDAKLAAELRKSFFEIVVAPSFDAAARTELAAKKNLRLIQAEPADVRRVQAQAPRLSAGLFGVFLQTYDVTQESWDQLQVVSSAAPPEKLHEDILTGLQYVRFLKSNSLCVVKDGIMVGAGLGQMSRVAATEIALRNAGKRAVGAVLVSDGFFPFADSLELAAKAKVGCVVAPAGSKRDMEVVAAANTLKLPLVFAPYRHFLH